MRRSIGILAFASLSLLALVGVLLFAVLGGERPPLALIGIPICLICFAISFGYLRLIWRRQTKADGGHVNAWLYLLLGIADVALPVCGRWFGDFRRDLVDSLHLTLMWELAGWAAIITSIRRIRSGRARADLTVVDPANGESDDDADEVA